jgi:SWI/SNF-related matrix-associated actin-dependent regulator 1 of chromatin subfamily A
LVIVPPSTLENWLREFANFSPQLVVEPYYGSQKERQDIAQRVLQEHEDVNVVVSTYDFAAKKEDSRFLKQLNPNVCVFDEGHVLKNPKSLKYQGLIRIPAKFRLLLTGTPLQNNLMELATLLGFILPQIFQERQGDLDFIFKHKASTRDADHAALLSAQRIARAKSMLTPFVLRRKKAQVLRHMPAKISRVEHCDMDPYQARIYDGFVEKGKEKLRLRAEGAKLSKDDENNPLMQLRKAAIHPMLFRRHFTDEKLKSMLDLLKMHEADEFSQPRDKIMMEMQNFSDYYLHRWCLLYPCIKKFDVPDLMWMDSGKVKALVRLINEYKKNGDRVLVFSQFTLVLDILEAVFETARIAYTRIDGATKVNERQTLIDEFRDDTSITAFLLSTGAGGTGINLMFANKVIIFDSSFNPQEDVQAENRAHRVGQTREVEVVRFVTKGTIEEQIYALGQSKLQLDDKVSGDADIATEKGEEMVAKMLLGNEKQGS